MPICQSQTNVKCPSKDGCPPGVCPDFEIKRHDTKPAFTVSVSDCDGPLEIEDDMIVEVSMWASSKLKRALTADATYFALSDDVGFEQSLVGDIIVIDRARAPEQMLITGHDEVNKFVRVQRGYNGTSPSEYKKNTALKIFRVLNSVGETNVVTQEVEQIDGTVTEEVTESQLIYEWQPNDTCMPGCYWLEFKLLKMDTSSMWHMPAAAVTPTFTSVTPADQCNSGFGVVWVRRFPVNSSGFLIKITDTHGENVV